jgi:alginate O-acetyltransferase complex protein AlgJ
MKNPPPGNLTVTRWTNVFLVAVFIALLWLPVFDTFFYFDHTPAFNEKRLPAQFPQFKSGHDGLKKYASGLESYFNDHFGFRNQLVHWHIQWQLALFYGGRSDVMMGKDGWLFFDENQMHMVEHYQGTLQFSPQELAKLRQAQEYRRDWLAQRGTQYVFIIVPDKQSIYPEYLPVWLKPIRHHTKLDQFIDYMHAYSTVTVLDLRPALRKAKQTAPTYYKTDSHWNFFGGFVASEEIAKVLSKKIPGLEPLSLDSFEFQKEQLKRGDLTTLLGVYAAEEDITLVPKINLPSLVETVQNSKFTVPTYFTSNASAKGTCIVFRDSFGPALKPFLGYHFGKVGYFWAPGGFETNTIEETKPDVVVSEIVERHFNALLSTDK